MCFHDNGKFRHRRSEAHVFLLGKRRKLVQRSDPLFVHTLFVSKNVGEANAPVRADLAMRYLPLLEKADEERSADIQN